MPRWAATESETRDTRTGPASSSRTRCSASAPPSTSTSRPLTSGSGSLGTRSASQTSEFRKSSRQSLNLHRMRSKAQSPEVKTLLLRWVSYRTEQGIIFHYFRTAECWLTNEKMLVIILSAVMVLLLSIALLVCYYHSKKVRRWWLHLSTFFCFSGSKNMLDYLNQIFKCIFLGKFGLDSTLASTASGITILSLENQTWKLSWKTNWKKYSRFQRNLKGRYKYFTTFSRIDKIKFIHRRLEKLSWDTIERKTSFAESQSNRRRNRYLKKHYSDWQSPG